MYIAFERIFLLVLVARGSSRIFLKLKTYYYHLKLIWICLLIEKRALKCNLSRSKYVPQIVLCYNRFKTFQTILFVWLFFFFWTLQGWYLFVDVGMGVLFLLLAAISSVSVIASSYYNNEFFPYTSNKEVGETWKNVVDVQRFIKESFSCECLYK